MFLVHTKVHVVVIRQFKTATSLARNTDTRTQATLPINQSTTYHGLIISGSGKTTSVLRLASKVMWGMTITGLETNRTTGGHIMGGPRAVSGVVFKKMRLQGIL